MSSQWEEEVTFLVSVLASTFQRQVTPAMLQGYLIGLSGMTVDEIKTATESALRTCKFMPTPAELRELSGRVIKPEDAAVIAWDTAVRAVEYLGWYRSIQFEDPAITATIRSLGGWQKFCEMCGGEEEKWLRKRFIDTYAVYCRVGVSVEAARPLAGEFERQNTLLGFHRAEDRPVMVTKSGDFTSMPAIPYEKDGERHRVTGMLHELAEMVAVQRHLEERE